MSKSIPLTVDHFWIWEFSVIFFACGSLSLERGVFSLLAFLFTVKLHDHKQPWYEMDYFRLRFHISVHYLRKPRQEAVDRNWWRVPREKWWLLPWSSLLFQWAFGWHPGLPGQVCTVRSKLCPHTLIISQENAPVLPACRIYKDVFAIQIPSFQMTLVNVKLMKKLRSSGLIKI